MNTVACKGGCERRVVVALEGKQKERRAQEEGAEEDEEDEEEAHEELERALVARYSKVIAEGHAENCMWRTSGCRDDVYRVQVVRPSVWQPELRKRCRSVLAINAAVVNVAFKALETEDAKTQPASRLVKDLPADLIGNEDAAADEVHATKSLTIALHGWRGSTEAGSELLNCDTCFQRIGLWMYQPDYKRSRHPHPDATDGAEEDLPIIDLQELHREHCPWRNAQAQVATGSLAGLNASQILQRIVASYARDVRRRSNEQSTETHSHAEDKGNEANGEADKRTPKASREEIVKQDRERESRLRKLKSMFSVRRKSTKAPTPAR